MRMLVRTTLAALTIASIGAAMMTVATHPALAQAAKDSPAQPPGPTISQPPQLKQIALTDKQIENVLASQKDMDAITDKLPENAPPDQKVVTQLDGVAKKYGFASYDDFNVVVDNISLVMSGIDSKTKKYVGSEAVIKQQIDQVQADSKMKADDKKQVLNDLNAALKAKPPEVENKGNIDLVVKYYDKLAAAFGEDDN
ncbi:hypothetical protein LQG66_29200 [Bradyrhizobium ontarionense]|uniref:Uncharacterized protein n=1 Tax=Bradyrhizobium ontarionense TaxID=2898149 RepID=A0ABY3R7H6_9BRAD|nr:hypothetical protein [Bradyrhizobium sp. A19]UFZ03278.1 hypothetical protein LQG66_29200 [Bradyrhizobium sp. A19]